MPKQSLRQYTTNGIHVRLQDELQRAVENFRRREADIPSKPEAVRRLLRQAVAAHTDANKGRSIS